MKKIALFSLVMCLGYVGIASADTPLGDTICGVKCTKDLEGKYLVCLDYNSEKVVDDSNFTCIEGDWFSYDAFTSCDNHVKPSGWKDLGLVSSNTNEYLFFDSKISVTKEGNAWIFSRPQDTSFSTICCSGCRQGFSWDGDNKKCVKTSKQQINQTCDPNHPELCNQNPREGQLGMPCAGKDENDQCYAFRDNVELGRCRNLKATKDGVEQMTCAPVKCKSGNYLWLNKDGNSMGYCHSLSYMEKMCSNNPCKCEDGKVCKPNIVDIPAYIKINGYDFTAEQRKNGAYQECHCVAESDNNTPESISCRMKFSGDIECNGKIKNIEEVIVPIPDDVVAEYGGCGYAESKLLEYFAGKFEEKKTEFKKLKDDVCRSDENGGGTSVTIPDNRPVGPSESEVNSAKRSLDSFFGVANANKSVWKDKDGNFNTARLASDLTAGVVLGTVGGVVSGVVIKKKQVEKGFDALNCVVGGQKVAGWGDEFSVGLRR